MNSIRYISEGQRGNLAQQFDVGRILVVILVKPILPDQHQYAIHRDNVVGMDILKMCQQPVVNSLMVAGVKGFQPKRAFADKERGTINT